MATLRVIRNKEVIAGIRNLGIYVDGVKVGKLSSGGIRDYEVSEGFHTIYVKMDGCTSPTIAFKASKEIKIIRVGSSTIILWYNLITFAWIFGGLAAFKASNDPDIVLAVGGLGCLVSFIVFLIIRKKYFWVHDDQANDMYRGPRFSDLY